MTPPRERIAAAPSTPSSSTPGQQQPDRSRAVGQCRGPEQGVDGRPIAVLRRSGGQHGAVVFDQKVMVRHGDVDLSRFQSHAVNRRTRGQRPTAVENLRQHAWCARWHVQDDDDRKRKVAWHACGHVGERLDPAG